MDARAVERAQAELYELKMQGVEGLLSPSASRSQAAGFCRRLGPLLVGGLGVAFLGARALVRRYLLLEHLMADSDAYTIVEVHRLALKAASSEDGRHLAAWLRQALDGSPYGVNERVESNRALLEEIVAALEDDRLALDPAAAVALDRLLTAGSGSCIYDSLVAADELRSRLRQVLSGFEDRRAA